MTPKEKAEELFYKYCELCADSSYHEAMAKKCALIAVDEIIQTYHSPMDDEQIQEWQQVRSEIEKL